jgi:hypothetical protein
MRETMSDLPTIPTPPIDPIGGHPTGVLAMAQFQARDTLRFSWPLRHSPDLAVRRLAQESVRSCVGALRRMRLRSEAYSRAMTGRLDTVPAESGAV